MTTPKNALAGRKPQIRTYKPDAGVSAWTEAEDAVLQSKYTTGGAVACMDDLPGRSRVAIYRRAQRLKLENGYVPPYKTLDAAGLEQLRAIAAGKSDKSVPSLARELELSVTALRRRAKKEGLTFPVTDVATATSRS